MPTKNNVCLYTGSVTLTGTFELSAMAAGAVLDAASAQWDKGLQPDRHTDSRLRRLEAATELYELVRPMAYQCLDDIRWDAQHLLFGGADSHMNA